jgi:hypothetical protein
LGTLLEAAPLDSGARFNVWEYIAKPVISQDIWEIGLKISIPDSFSPKNGFFGRSPSIFTLFH